MKITTATEKAFLTQYYTLLSPVTRWTARETEVAVAIASVYLRLQRLKATQDEDTPEEERIDNVMVALKEPMVLENLTRYLNMPFSSFRNYVSKLKQKGFFKEGDINPTFLPANGSVSIEVVLEKQGDGR